LATSANPSVAVDNRDVLRGLESRLKESFNELHRWQSAVEGVVQQAMIEGGKDHIAELQLTYQEKQQHAADRLTDISPSGQQGIGKSTDATLAQLEDDIAKLRVELKGGSFPSGQGGVLFPVSRELGGGQFGSRPLGSKPEITFQSDMPRAAADEIDVEAWKTTLWQGSSLSRRENEEISRLYDKLHRLEGEAQEFRKPAFAVAEQLRRRPSSSSNLVSRKNRTR
jgi:hypothetical protein